MKKKWMGGLLALALAALCMLPTQVQAASTSTTEKHMHGDGECILWTDERAVSYTHLDVYKRQPLCKECAGKVDLPDGVLERMSLDQFKKYIAYYDENQALRDAFKETDSMSFGFLSGELLADTEHRLLRLKGYDGALVFPASALVSFRFLEDGKTLFEGKADGLH